LNLGKKKEEARSLRKYDLTLEKKGGLKKRGKDKTGPAAEQETALLKKEWGLWKGESLLRNQIPSKKKRTFFKKKKEKEEKGTVNHLLKG